MKTKSLQFLDLYTGWTMEQQWIFLMENKEANMKRNYGWIPDIPDQRDFLYRAVMRPPAVLPKKVDLRKDCSPTEDQEALGSCTAQALAGNLEFLDVKNGDGYIDQSRLFIYYNERVIEGRVKEDSGAMLRDGIKSLVRWGSCPEKEWPYNINNFAVKPPPAVYTHAKKHTITSYHRVLSLDEMRSCLAEGYPFVFGFAVYEGFESQEIAQTGIVNMPKPTERMLGGHAVMAVGYDDRSQRFIVRNSWGTKWGMNGYFTMPYMYLSSQMLADDFWTIRRQK